MIRYMDATQFYHVLQDIQSQRLFDRYYTRRQTPDYLVNCGLFRKWSDLF